MNKYQRRYSFPSHLIQPQGRTRWHPNDIAQFTNFLGILDQVQDWSVAIDGGTYAGTWTWMMAQKFKTVHAFEPTPVSYAALVENMTPYPHVICHQQAIGDRIGHATMNMPKGVLIKYAAVVDESGDVEMVTIDSLNLPGCGLMKLDLNGGDTLGLYGARNTLQKYHPLVIVEEKALGMEIAGTDAHATHAFMTEIGYRQERVIRPDLVYVWKGQR